MDTNELYTKKEITVSIILSIVTCGIYAIIWAISLAKSAVHVKDENDQGTLEIVLMIFLPFIGLYMAEKKFCEGAKERGFAKDDKSIIYLLLGLVGLWIVGFALMQDEINKFIDALEAGNVEDSSTSEISAGTYSATVSRPVNEATNIETLKQYKELFDNGVITQEEFDQVKSKLLNL